MGSVGLARSGGLHHDIDLQGSASVGARSGASSAGLAARLPGGGGRGGGGKFSGGGGAKPSSSSQAAIPLDAKEMQQAVHELELAHGVGIGRGDPAQAAQRLSALHGKNTTTYTTASAAAAAAAAAATEQEVVTAEKDAERMPEEELDEKALALRKKKERDREERQRERLSEELQRRQGRSEDVYWGDMKVNTNELGASWDLLKHLKVSGSETPLFTHKRQFVYYNETMERTMLRHYLEYLEGNETIIYHFPRDLFDLLPLEEPKFLFKKCAIVGNSGVVLLRENGEEIDKHDAIIRINVAPVEGFEAFVGRRTTFDIVNAHNVKELLTGVRRWRSDSSESKLVMFETASHHSRYKLCTGVLRRLAYANPLLLNPAFSNIAHKTWVQLKFLLESERNSNYNRKPMSGFFAAFFAMQICEKTNLYGFDAYTSRRRNYRYHYFDNVQGFTDVHSFDLALEVFRLIERHNPDMLKIHA